ncbi:MAG: hypothetical protein IJG23_06125, partial [Clostridia bacterium]|nr:hypothetical protein [Clostridia bacterium]
MKGSTVLKRSLSLVLTVVMLFSCWVFTAPTANAAAGTYYVKVFWNVSNTHSGEQNEFQVWYKKQDGTEDSFNKTYTAKSSGDQTATFDVSGIPYKFKMWVRGNNFDPGEWWMKKITVSPNSDYTTDAITLFTGTVGGKKGTVGGGTSNYTCDFSVASPSVSIGSEGTNSSTTATGNVKACTPYAASVTTSYSNSSFTVPTTTSVSVSSTVVKDQVGVVIGDPTISYAANWYYYDSSGTTAAAVDYSVNSSTGAVTAATGGWKANGHGTHRLNVKTSATFTNKTVTTTNTITITYTQYTYTWNWKETNTSNLDSPSDKSTTLSPYYGDTPSIPSTATATKAYYTTAKHWSGGSYTTPAMASAAKSYTMTYSVNGVAHSYTYSGITNDHTYHKGTCSCGYALSTTF